MYKRFWLITPSPTPTPTQTPTPTPSPTPNPLVGSWHCNEGTGTTAYDSSTYGNDGSLIGGASWVSGKNGYGISLDGTNGRVSIADSASLEGMSQLTVAIWVKLNQLPTNDYNIIGKNHDGTSLAYHIKITSEGYARFGISTSEGSLAAGTDMPTVPVQLSTNTWYHIVGTYNGYHVKIYLNGQLIYNNPTELNGNISSNDSYLKIGAAPNSGYDYTNAIIDEVLIYSRDLSTAEVQDLYNSY
jgi:large repetitive protein